MTPRVSIISSIYESKSTLQRHLESLLSQDFPGEYELIVCDDGSWADNLSIVRGFGSPPRLRYIWQQNEGFRLGASRNNGLRCALGELIIFVDGDVVVGQDFVSKHVALHDGRKKIVLGTRKWLFVDEQAWADQMCETRSIAELIECPLPTESIDQKLMADSPTPWAACIGCNLSVFPRGDQSFDEQFEGWGLEDWEYVYRLSSEGNYEVCFVDRPQVLHVEFGRSKEYRRRLRNHTEIAAYIKNLLHFLDRHPGIDQRPLLKNLQEFELDFDFRSHTWVVLKPEDSIRVAPEVVLEKARQWLAQGA